MAQGQNIHGTGLLLGDTGLLLRGPSGSGKSVLALALLDRWDLAGVPAFLIADDRVDLIRSNEGLLLSAPAALAGLIELRGRGIVSRPHCQSAPLRLVVDIVPDLVRMVEEEDLETEIEGHRLARAPVPEARLIGLGHQLLLVIEAVRASQQRTAP